MSKPQNIYSDEISAMQPGLDRAILRVLGYHAGKNQAIDKDELIRQLNLLGYGNNLRYATFERQIRLTIVALRKNQHLICSSSGEGGYFIAKDRAEYDEFAQVEYRSKIIDMSDTLRAMDEGARAAFGLDAPAEQPRLI